MKNKATGGYEVIQENVTAVTDDYKTRSELEEVRLSMIQIVNFVNHFEQVVKEKITDIDTKLTRLEKIMDGLEFALKQKK